MRKAPRFLAMLVVAVALAAALAEFRRRVGDRNLNLQVETGLMDIDGKIEMIG